MLEDGSALRPEQPDAHLRILGTTDLHLHLMPWDYLADVPSTGAGLLLTAGLIGQLRAEVANCLLFDNGDSLHGSPMAEMLASDAGLCQADAPPPPHPMIAAMNRLGYDAATLGNHDFDGGVPLLRAHLAQARFPVVLANVRTRADAAGAPAPLVPPWVILDRRIRDRQGNSHLLRVGVIGFAPPTAALWDSFLTRQSIVTEDIVDCARRLVPQLRAAGADLVVALAHCGIDAEQHSPGMENAAVPLAAVDGIDAVIAGHTHRVFPGPKWARSTAVDPEGGHLHGKPAVMAGFHGSHLGVIDLVLRRDARGWRVAESRARALAVAEGADQPDARPAMDPVLWDSAAPAHDRTRRRLQGVVGRTLVPLHSHFARIAPGMAMAAMADAYRAAARRLLASHPESALPLLVAVAPSRNGGDGGVANYVDIAPGTVTLRHLAGLSPHVGALTLLEITGAGIAQWLEHSASGFARLQPGLQDQPLFDRTFPPYLADQIDGLTYTIDLTAPARTGPSGAVIDPTARRVRDIALGGRALAASDRVVLVCDSFRAGGGGGHASGAAARHILRADLSTREALIDWLAPGPLVVLPRPGWRLAQIPATGAWFDSAPAALAHLTSPGGHAITDLGPAPRGFRRFRLTLGD